MRYRLSEQRQATKAVFSVVLIALVATAGCRDRTGSEFEVGLESGPAAEASKLSPAGDEGEVPVRFAYTSVLSPERSVLTYARLGSYLSDKLRQPVEIVRRRTYAEINELLRTGDADAGLICTGAFAAAEGSFGPEAIAIPIINGKRTYRSYVITRRDSGLASFEDLEGTVFAFTDPLSNTGYRYVAARLHALGVDAEDFFSQFVFTYGHDNSIEAVRDGLVDAGSVDSLVWDGLAIRDATLGRDVVVIDRSEEFPINPVAVSPDIQPGLRARLQAAFLLMQNFSDGRLVLEELGTDGFVKPTDVERTGYKAIARSWRDLASSSSIGRGSS